MNSYYKYVSDLYVPRLTCRVVAYVLFIFLFVGNIGIIKSALGYVDVNDPFSQLLISIYLLLAYVLGRFLVLITYYIDVTPAVVLTYIQGSDDTSLIKSAITELVEAGIGKYRYGNG